MKTLKIRHLLAVLLATFSGLFCPNLFGGDPKTFFDNFEAPTLDPFWTKTEYSGSVIFPSTEQAHSGSQSVKLSSSYNTGEKEISIFHSFNGPQYAEVSAWIYDNAAGVYSANYFMFSAGNLRFFTMDWDGDYYWYQNWPSQPTVTSIRRTQGWHQVVLRASEDSSSISIDGATVYRDQVGIPFAILIFRMFGPTWRPAWVTYFDDFSFQALGPKLSVRVSQVELCYNTLSNTIYQLQYLSAFDGSTWSPLGGPFLGTGSPFCTNDIVSLGQPRRFYRLILAE